MRTTLLTKISGFWLKTYGESSFIQAQNAAADTITALNEIGIFRKEGSQTRMRKLQAIFETPPGVRLNVIRLVVSTYRVM